MVQVRAVSVLEDNYVWILAADEGAPSLVVDPGVAAPVAAALERLRAPLSAVLLTHHHGDHTGGAAELARRFSCPVLGPVAEDIPAVDRPLSEGAHVDLAGVQLEVLEVPGHTRGHIAFFGEGLLLAGDTLFGGGCGRVFEGSFEQMWRSLTRLAALPPTTALYCGHEYTLANLGFASQVEPDNGALARRFEEAAGRRRRGEPTLPSTLAEERATNPFLRCGEPAVRAAAEGFAGRTLGDEAEVFAVIRGWKDGWRG